MAGPAPERLQTSKSSVEIEFPQPHIMLVRVTGAPPEDMLPRVLALRDGLLKQSRPLVFFDDFAKATHYSTRMRVELTAWMFHNRSRVGAVHLLSGNKIVDMGVTVANLALNGLIRCYPDRPSFEAALARELGK